MGMNTSQVTEAVLVYCLGVERFWDQTALLQSQFHYFEAV